jgi:17beta-estradiol 17-dehydrogenase / very-long-chain 3-oxoacyl-CoA reductase
MFVVAVVTGATDGIGKAMAFELAKKGLNILLISRSQEKLQSTQNELLSKYSSKGIECKIFSIDFSSFDANQRDALSAFITGMDIGVLINNVGMSYPFPKYFHELSNEHVDQLMRLNVDSTTWMTKIVLPGMVERKRGAIVNVGSGKIKTLQLYLSSLFSLFLSFLALFLFICFSLALSPLTPFPACTFLAH